MIVSLRKLTSTLKAALRVVKFETLESSGDFIALEIKNNKMVVSSFGGGIDAYLHRFELEDEHPNTGIIRLPIKVAQEISKLKVTDDDELTLEFTPKTVKYSTSLGAGEVNQRHSLVAADIVPVSKGTKFLSFQNTTKLKYALRLALQAPVGWSKNDLPQAAEHVRFSLAESTEQVDDLIGYQSGMTLGIYGTDTQRLFETHLPVFYDQPLAPNASGQRVEAPVTLELGTVELHTRKYINEVFSIENEVAQILLRIIPDGENMILRALAGPNGRVVSWALYNADTYIRFRAGLALRDAALEQFTETGAYVVKCDVNPTADLASSVKKVSDADTTKHHGMTVALARKKITFSSPENTTPYQHCTTGANEIRPYGGEGYLVVDGAGVHSALLLNKKSIFVEFIWYPSMMMITNYADYSRVTLLSFKPEN